jgi:hypothetical protein
MADSIRCIFCLETGKAPTEEHIFPEAVGGTLTTWDVCKPCNDKLGHSVDKTVTNHLMVEIVRFKHGIAGKSGGVPNPLREGVVADESRRKVRTTFDPTGERPPSIFYLPLKEVLELDGDRRELHISVDGTAEHEIPALLKKAFLRAGLAELTDKELASFATTTHQPEDIELEYRLSIDISDYRRGLMKIAYELACRWLGESYINDQIASDMRAFILDDQQDDAKKLTQHMATWSGEMSKELKLWPGPNLLGLSFSSAHGIQIVVSILGMLGIRVLVSKANYPEFTDQFVLIDPVNKVHRESRLMDEWARCAMRARKQTED